MAIAGYRPLGKVLRKASYTKAIKSISPDNPCID